MAIDVLLGLQWGDEGKGKIVDVLTKGYDIIARFQGGPNAGHTLEFEGVKHVLHTIPSGVFHTNAINLVGNGVVIDPVIFLKELETLEKIDPTARQRILISRRAHLILPTHRLLDAASEASKGKNKIGSTLKGIGPTYMDKTGRNGIRVGDIELPYFMDKYNQLVAKHKQLLNNYTFDYTHLPQLEEEWMNAIERFKRLQLIDSEHYLHRELKAGKCILAEGAQGSMLDIDFGTYPYVTSSNTTASGACNGLGIPPTKIRKVIGIFKAYATRVGSGPFPTELHDETGELIRQQGREFGSTTGRPRRCGWLDLPALKYAIEINGVTEMMMMKADVLSIFDTIKVATHYEYKGEKIDYLPYQPDEQFLKPVYVELPGWKMDITKLTDYKDAPYELRQYVDFIEQQTGVKITLVSVGPDRAQTLRL
ncbi:adenylosuccinate synthetase [Thermaurantimonas aggregans]|uniref:Adenylosuccinate synthetase n=1 Tax=Thermaurantimonas aggregans TaxID=2173829 RepID=A0A401XM40_9FLAO|nr:adenylosuccinate synthase [Thermaurantimonas aggregans]MCX8148070.1 adenylosuccinate synthase [Thermaurantimonas aggregans]GCD78058.1 adenylosuccinate synthetase [Thermaurantimonas aggregans]